jgi:mannose-6-phosphate isomerase
MSIESARAELEHWLVSQALPLWWEHGADRLGGGYHDALCADGTPARRPKRARVQARQSYVYAAAGALGWSGPWRKAMLHGLDFFLEQFQRPDGLFRPTAAAGEVIAEDAPVLYDQAFALFAMAEVYRCSPERGDLPRRARGLLTAVRTELGWRRAASRSRRTLAAISRTRTCICSRPRWHGRM